MVIPPLIGNLSVVLAASAFSSLLRNLSLNKLIFGLVYDRYYLHQFRDAYRQAAIDASLGKKFEEESILVPGVNPPAMDASELERVKQLVEDSKRIIISDNEVVLGGWPLIDADATADSSRSDMDTVLLLSTEAYYVGEVLIPCRTISIDL